jgi:hypothetical protein
MLPGVLPEEALMSREIELSEFLSELRRELDNSRKEAVATAKAGDGVLFGLKKTEVEVSLTVEKTGGGSGKVKFSVLGSGVEIGGQGGMASAAVHRLKLELEAVSAKTGGPLIVSRGGEEGP